MKKNMDIKLLGFYFVIGGLVVALSTYLGSHGRGLLAAFVGVFPAVTLITFIAIHLQSGTPAVVSYAKGMLILLPPWILYVLGIIFLMPRLSLAATLAISVGLYVILALLIIKLTG
jgi:uncharacterized membrane protein (GlpM family)